MLHIDTEEGLSSPEGTPADTAREWAEIWRDEPGIAALSPQQFYAQLRSIAEARGYSTGFAYRTFTSAVGHSPPAERNTLPPEAPSQAVTWWTLGKVRQFQVLQRRLAADAKRKAERGEPMLRGTEIVPKPSARKSQPKPKPAPHRAAPAAQPFGSRASTAPPKPRNLPKSFDLTKPGHVERAIEFVIACGGVTDWEARFMATITAQPYGLTFKQREVLLWLIRRARKVLN